MNFGIFEGESEQLRPKYEDYDTFFAYYGGETTKQVGARMVATITHIMKQKNHESVLIVSHSAACRYFYHYWIEERLRTFQTFPNCSILVFDYDGERFIPIEIVEHDFLKIV